MLLLSNARSVRGNIASLRVLIVLLATQAHGHGDGPDILEMSPLFQDTLQINGATHGHISEMIILADG